MTSQPNALTFEGLVAAIGRAHAVLAQQATKAVNISLTLRNWFIGFYIAEFELQGANRAGYGDRLIPELVAALNSQNVSNAGRRQLYAYLASYRAYPQIVRTALVQSINLFPLVTLEEKVRTAPALSTAEPAIDPEKLLSQLSHLGQLNSYVSYYKENQMQESDQPPIGILLCTRKNHELVEYALAGMSNNIFVSRYQMELPGKEEIAAFLHRAVEELEGISHEAPKS